MAAPIVPAERSAPRARLRLRPGTRQRFARSAPTAIIAGLLGFVVVALVAARTPERAILEAESEEDLARILASLDTEGEALREEIDALRRQIADLRSSTERDAASLAAAEAQLRSLQVLAGTVPVAGPGVVVTIADPARAVRYELLLDAVQELRDAGAEAVAVNGVRVGASSSFADRDGTVLLDGEPLSPPYEIAAIGQASTLEGGLKIPGGAVDAASSVRGVEVQVIRRSRVELPALSQARRGSPGVR